MGRIKKRILFPFLLVILISGFLGYYIIQTPLHEMGHYVFAYAFNQNAIKGVSLPYEKLSGASLIDVVSASVNYSYPMTDSFSIPQIFLIAFAGFLFELAYMTGVMFIIRKLLSGVKSIGGIYLVSILFGFYMMSFTILAGWFNIFNPNADVYKIVLSSPSIYTGILVVSAAEVFAAFYYMVNIRNVSKNYLATIKKIYHQG